jgi:molybdopterin-guanine dinucleotide biosynthesis protein B
VGKTTLLEKLIPELKRRGYRVATVKHHADPGFEIDQPGKDTWRHARAGSDHVVIAAPDKVASIRRVDRELTLDEIVAGITDVDIILTEGYKWAGKPQIEVIRSVRSREPICNPDELIALATDVRFDLNVPQFDLDDAASLADLIEQRFLSPSMRNPQSISRHSRSAQAPAAPSPTAGQSDPPATPQPPSLPSW